MQDASEKKGTDIVHDEDRTSLSPSETVKSKRLVRKIDWRLMPLCAWVYLLNYLDRGNIGNAKVLNEETNDSLVQVTKVNATQYAIVLSLFSLAYMLFEVPSNWIMKRYVRPSWWLAFLLAAWGAFTLGFAGVQNYASVLILRFFIGVFEAGFFPGIVYLIAVWYRPEERSLRIAFVVASATLAGAFGGSIAYGMGKLNNHGGLEGFRWLFVVEGVITMASALLVLKFMPDFPQKSWLKGEDASLAVSRMGEHGYTKQHATKQEIMETVFSPRMMAHYLAYVVDCIPLGSLTFYTPTIVNGLGYNSITAQLMTIPPWVVGYCVSLILSYSADKFNARGWHIAGASIMGGAGWLTAGLLPAHAYTQRYGALIMCACGAFPCAGPLSSWVTCNVPSIATLAIAAALNNSGAGVSQIIAQWIWRASEKSRGYPTGNFVCAACSFATAALAIGLRIHYGRMNAKGSKDAGGKSRVWLL